MSLQFGVHRPAPASVRVRDAAPALGHLAPLLIPPLLLLLPPPLLLLLLLRLLHCRSLQPLCLLRLQHARC